VKRIAKFFFSFFLFAIAINGCELIENCGTCSLVTEVDGVETGRTPGILYCDEEYEERKNAEPVTVGNTTTYYDCD
jgi:hypothetical protein